MPGKGAMMYEAKKTYFDANADALWAAPEYGPEEMLKLARLFRHIGSLKGFKILEPGCGTGRLTEILSNHVGEEGLVVALDISLMMVEAARRRTGLTPNIEIHQCAVEEFWMKREEYDLIVCHQVFPHFEDKSKVLKALASALKPKGRIIVIHFINRVEINDRHRKAGTAVEMDMMPGRDEMECLFTKAGLEIECILDDHLGYFLSSSLKKRRR